MTNQMMPRNRPRGLRGGKKSAGTHLPVVPIAPSNPAPTGPTNCDPNSSSARGRLMLPVSRLAAIGKASTVSSTAVVIGRRLYAQWMDHSRPITVAPRQVNQATLQGSSDGDRSEEH